MIPLWAVLLLVLGGIALGYVAALVVAEARERP